MQIPRLHKETALFSATRKISSSFEVLAESITSLVEGEETYTGPDGETHVSAFGTLLKQTANNILIKATKSASSAADVGSSIISSFINVAPESIKIAASHVDIEGAAIFRSGGKLAKVVKASSTQWYSSTSATQRTGGSWSTNQPAVTAGRYIWERTYYEYTDGTNAYKPSEGGVCVTAPTDISATVTGVDVEYVQGTSSTTAPSSGWSTTAPTIAPGKYLWTRTKTTYSNGATQYTKVTCVSGTNGKIVTSAKEQYYLSTSSSSVTGGSWSDTCPAWAANKYIWTRTHLTYADGTTGATTATLATALNDANSKANQTITGVDVEYADSTSSTTAPSSGWSTTAPTWQAGHYIWQRTKTVTPSGTTYSRATCISGRDGVNGANGANGADGRGITTIVEQYYQSTSSSSQSGGSWSTTPATYVKGRYYWTRSKITWTDGNITYTDPVLANDITSVADIANASVKTAIQLWYTKANTTPPDKPKSRVTSNSTAAGDWRTVVPAYNASFPNYFYCWQYQQMDGTYTWSDVVFDAQATETMGTARGAQARSQLIFKSARAGVNSVSGTTTWVTETGQVQGQWTTKHLEYDSDFPVIFCATQAQTVAQMAAGSTCSCTTPVKDDTLTKIDGGHITTGTIDASKVTVTNINASNITSGTLSSDYIAANSIAIGKLTQETQDAINNAGGDAAYRGVCSTSATTANKVVACSGFKLVTGATVTVYMSTANAYGLNIDENSLTLNVNSTGAKPIYVGSNVVSNSNQLMWCAGATITFTYDGTYWTVADSPGTWNGGTCSAWANTHVKIASCGKIALFNGASIKLLMTADNTSDRAMLYVQQIGYYYIYFGNTSVSPTIENGYSWRAGSVVEFVFDGQCFRTGSRTYINAGSITTGTISTDRLDATSIQTNIVKTCELNADMIKSGKISANYIRGGTIEGVQIKSAYNGNNPDRYILIDSATIRFYGYHGYAELWANTSSSSDDDPNLVCSLHNLDGSVIEDIGFSRHHIDLRMGGSSDTTQYETCGIAIYRDDGDASYSGQVHIFAPNGLYINRRKYTG